MKKILLIAIIAISVFSCKDKFLEIVPQGELTIEQLKTKEGVEALLIGAYGLLNGNVSGDWGNYASAPSQWLFGDVASDNAHKGTVSSDQVPMNMVELHTMSPVNDNISVMWNRNFEGIIRCNNTIKVLSELQATDKKLPDERAKQIEAEAKFLRGHYYFLLKRLFVNVPYIDEKTTTADAAKTPNDKDVMPNIQSDFEFAVANLPATKINGEVGRVDKIAAQAYLGKVLLYQKKYPEALALFNTVIAAKPDLTTLPFTDNFDISKENGPECIFTVQHVINPDGGAHNANVGDMLAGGYGSAPMNCCGFFQPTIDLVNAYKVDANGLPLLDNSYRNNPYKSDLGMTSEQKKTYVLDKTIRFDPRVDRTAGRRGVPFRDWGVHPGDDWIRDPANGGPFTPMKNTIEMEKFPGNTVSWENFVTALNVNIIRLADIYLLAAECNTEIGNLSAALNLVNKVRARAAAIPVKTVDGVPTANYMVGQYPSFPSADYARNAIRFERRLELAMEGHRYYDLVRWGIAKQVIESYSAFEGALLSPYAEIQFGPEDNYFPIPQEQIDRSNGALKQNQGY